MTAFETTSYKIRSARLARLATTGAMVWWSTPWFVENGRSPSGPVPNTPLWSAWNFLEILDAENNRFRLRGLDHFFVFFQVSSPRKHSLQWFLIILPSETREFAPWPMCCPNFIMKQEQRSRPGATQGGHKEAIFCDGSPDSSPARSFHASRPLEHGSMPQRRRNTTKRAGRSDDGAMMTPGWQSQKMIKGWSNFAASTFRYFQILSDTFRYFQILSPPIGPSVCKNVCSICAGASFGWGSTENQRLLQAQMVCFCRCPGACSPSPESPVISRHVMPVSGLHTWNVHTIRGFQAVQQSATRLGSAWVAPRICQTPRILRNKHVTVFGLSRNATTIWGSVKNSVYGTVLGNDASYLAEVTLMLARGPRAQSHILQPSIKWYSFFSVFQLTGWNRQNRFPIWGFPIHLWRDWLQFFHTTCRWRLRRVYLSKQESLEV